MSRLSSIAHGLYDATNVAGSISLPWNPALVLIGCNQPSQTLSSLCVKLPPMPGGQYLRCIGVKSGSSTNCTTTLQASGLAIDPNQFTPSDASGNKASGQTYSWLAVRDGPEVEYGSYVGTGAAGLTQVLKGTYPGQFVIIVDITGAALYAFSSNDPLGAGIVSVGSSTSIAVTSNNCFGMNVDGFSVAAQGTNNPNISGHLYYYISFNDMGNGCRVFENFARTQLETTGVAYDIQTGVRPDTTICMFHDATQLFLGFQVPELVDTRLSGLAAPAFIGLTNLGTTFIGQFEVSAPNPGTTLSATTNPGFNVTSGASVQGRQFQCALFYGDSDVAMARDK